MKKQNSGYTMIAFVLFVFTVACVVAANNSAPSGWAMSNRSRALYALGEPRAYRAVASVNNTINPTGVLAGDVIGGIVNLSDPTEAQVANSAITVAADTITQSGTSWTVGETYLVTLWRPKADIR
jgi:hypothetical protein